MGSFANLGALTGAASGWNEGSKAAEKAKQHKLDQMREERLETLKHERTLERDKAGYAQENKILGAEQGFDTGEREAAQKFETSERTASQRFDEEQGRLDREGDLAIEDRKKAAAKDKDKKWTYKTTEDKTIQNIDGSTSVAKGVTKVTNPYDHKTYEQKGNIFVLTGGDKRVRYPKEKARYEKILMEEPTHERISQYVNRFGYIPADVLAASERYYESGK